jgi:DNA-3-methyladenine glycosylase
VNNQTLSVNFISSQITDNNELKLDVSTLKELPREFFIRQTEIVAKELIGKLFVRFMDKNTLLAAEIIETEAYLPENDPACHASLKKTKRNAPMFELGGILYVYFIYGNHFCVNIVTETENKGAAVLLRSAKPILGIDFMQKNRGKNEIELLCKGPGNFAKAFAIDKLANFDVLNRTQFYVLEYNNYKDNEIVQTQRVGISSAKDLPLRFYLKDSKYVSKK